MAQSRDAVLLDFGGTLDADGVHWAPRFHQAYLAAGSTVPFSQFEPVFAESDRQLARLPGIRSLGFRATIDAQIEILQRLLPADTKVNPARVADHFHAAAQAVVARNRPVLERLADRRRLAVVSNFTGNLDRCLAELNLLSLFSVAVDSAVVGVTKPSPGIFTLALTQLGTPAERSWMVGDNFAADVVPAAALGMRTCWIAPRERSLPRTVPDVPTARIDRLDQLEAIVTGTPVRR
jgi:putative hydrolase of the HAD superfamily